MKWMPLGMGVLALALAWYATAHGAGIGPDSVRYLAAAHSIPHGAVLDSTGSPLTHFPPGYPLALALGSPRVVQALLFGCMIGVIAWATVQLGGTPTAGAIAALLVLSTQGIAELGAWLWSEPLAITLVLVGLAFLKRRPMWSALSIAGAILTRYAFGAFGLAGVLLVWKREGWRPALRWTVIAWLPFAVWVARDELVIRGATDRRLAWHPPPWSLLRFGPMNLGGWVDPRPVYAQVAIAIGIAVLVALVYVAIRPPTPSIETLAVAAIAYLVCLLVARCLADPAIPFLQRLMAPTGVLIAMIAAILIAPRRWLVLLACVVIAVKSYDTLRWANAASRQVLFREVPHTKTAP